MMKKIVAGLFFLSLLLIAAALIAPGFIDWSAHKEQILSQLKPYIARKIDVGGNVSFRIIPNPQIVLEDVTLSNAEGAKADNLMKLKQLEVRMKLGPLLQGRFEVENINLANPELDLEVLDDGSNNWSGIFKKREEGEGGNLSQTADSIQLNQVTMTGGTLHYLNQVTGTTWEVDNLNLTVAADTLFGPYHITGDMLYNKAAVGIEIGTGKYESGTPVSITIAFNPAEAMPQVKLSGVADLSSGVDLQTQLTIGQGNIASLFHNDFLNSVDFMKDTADVTAMLDLKGSEARLTDIKAKFGKKGELDGELSIAFAQGKKPEMTADLSGSDLQISGKSAFLDVPDGFDSHLKLKGKNIGWEGVNLPAVSLSADTNGTDWAIKDARLNLPGKSLVKMAGVVTPKNKFSAYSIDITTEDLQKMLHGNLLADTNILKELAASGLVKKLSFTSSLDMRADKISLSDIDAKANTDTKISGVLNITRGGTKPAFQAHLNFDNGDIAAPLSDAWADFMGKVMKADAEFDISVKNFSKGGVNGTDFAFKGKAGDDGLSIENMSGTLPPSGSFQLSGKLTSLNPLGGMDMNYSFKVPQLGVLSTLGVELPPPLWGSSAAELQGTIKGDAKKFAFTAQGGDTSLDGTATAGNQGTFSYDTNVSMKHATWAQLGLPVDQLISGGKPFDFAAKVTGTRGNYQFNGLKAGSVSGTLSRKDGNYAGELVADTIDFDSWLWNDWKVNDPIDLKLKGKTLTWHSDDISNPELSLEANAHHIKASGVKGGLWGGDLTADVEADKADNSWKGTLKGDIAGADLQQLATLMEFKGFTVGQGDLSFDVAEDGKKDDANWFHGMDGDLGMKAQSLTVKDFGLGSLSDYLADIKSQPPEDFSATVSKMLHGGDTEYKNVEGKFKIGDGKITIDKLKLANADATVTTDGAFNLGPETFNVQANVQLKSPASVPMFSVSRSGEMKNAADYTVNTKPLENWLIKNAPIPEAPPEAVKPVQGDNQTAAPPAADDTDNQDSDTPPVSPPPPAVTPDDDSNATIINNEPVDTEQLEAPPQDTQQPQPAPQPDGPPKPVPLNPPPADNANPPESGNKDGIKGILDRLNTTPGEPEPPVDRFNEQKPDAPQPDTKDEILPKE